jgi:WD40 repeat protein
VFKGGGGSVWADGFRCLVSAVCGQGRWLLASDSYKSIHVYDVANKRLLHTIPLPLRCSDLCGSLAYPRALVRYVDGGMSLIDVLSGKIVQQFSDPGDGCSAYTLSCSLGGPNESLVLHCGEGEQAIYPSLLFLNQFLTDGSDGSISVFNKETGELITRLKAHDQRCNSVQWSPVDPHLFASASDDGRVLL